MTDLVAITSIHPIGLAEPPEIRTDHGVTVKWRTNEAELTVYLASHDRPVEYLRKWAASLNVAANELEALS